MHLPAPDLPLWGSWAAVMASSGCSGVSYAALGGSEDPYTTITCHQYLMLGGVHFQLLLVYLKCFLTSYRCYSGTAQVEIMQQI